MIGICLAAFLGAQWEKGTGNLCMVPLPTAVLSTPKFKDCFTFSGEETSRLFPRAFVNFMKQSRACRDIPLPETAYTQLLLSLPLVLRYQILCPVLFLEDTAEKIGLVLKCSHC